MAPLQPVRKRVGFDDSPLLLQALGNSFLLSPSLGDPLLNPKDRSKKREAVRTQADAVIRKIRS